MTKFLRLCFLIVFTWSAVSIRVVDGQSDEDGDDEAADGKEMFIAHSHDSITVQCPEDGCCEANLEL